MRWNSYQSPFGLLTFVGDKRGLREVHFPGRAPALDSADCDPDALRAVHDQMEEYFAGSARPSRSHSTFAGSARPSRSHSTPRDGTPKARLDRVTRAPVWPPHLDPPGAMTVLVLDLRASSRRAGMLPHGRRDSASGGRRRHAIPRRRGREKRRTRRVKARRDLTRESLPQRPCRADCRSRSSE
jgi:hypothetical protein